MRIIDGHVHVGSWRTPDFSGRTTEVREAAALYEGLGYASALVMPTDVGDNVGLLAALDQCDYPFRFCAWIDPNDPDLDAFLAKAAPRIAALKIHPSFLRERCDAAVFDPYYRWAGEHGVPVLVHCGRWQEMASYRFPIASAERHPGVPIVLCHMGGDGTDLVEKTVALLAETGVPNAYLGTESIRQFWIVQHAIDRLGPERVIFGSDYNLNHPGSFEAIVGALSLDEEGKNRVFFDNLNELWPAHLRIPTP